MATIMPESDGLFCRRTAGDRAAQNPFWRLSIFPFEESGPAPAAFDLDDALSFEDYEPLTEPEALRRPDPSPEVSVSLMPTVSRVGGGVVCAVCMEEFASGACGKMMPCSHVYHQECIALWLAEDGSCPLCRCRVLPEL
ncbi:E3 ubiquitin-protein ligase [Nymphaea thermarum]|nr:E3 ubiquitin-protein ligase [Nymphaea thermarum]